MDMTNMVSIHTNTIIRGDALCPASTDLIAQLGRVDADAPIPDGWRVLTAVGHAGSLVGRIVFRCELEDAT
jgi:hypothetical protein|tara:strand:+ start:554 stop:766 length:213 start_codon:yes stop_codon:yes gene_type:complete